MKHECQFDKKCLRFGHYFEEQPMLSKTVSAPTHQFSMDFEVLMSPLESDFLSFFIGRTEANIFKHLETQHNILIRYN